MKKYFYFGEEVEGFDVRVLNEREVRAGAGILFLFAIVSFLSAWLIGVFFFTKIFVVAFLIDFFIRVFVNPKYAPSLILGRFVVNNQKVEYVGAPQKRFAWGIGFFLALVMLFTMNIFNIVSPLNLIICLICLTFLFFESVFGICVGCKMYNALHKDKAKLCPGGTCETHIREDIQKVNFFQIGIIVIFFLLIVMIPVFGIIKSDLSDSLEIGLCGLGTQTDEKTRDVNLNTDCDVPEWVMKIGRSEQWKAHNCD